MSHFWIQTFSGIKFDLWGPDQTSIYIEDIAHHLSIINRFIGASKFPYSVAEHSINACKVAPQNLELELLLHDAHEAYTNDLSTILKQAIRQSQEPSSFDKIAQIIERAIEIKFNLALKRNHSIIKNIDLTLALTERNKLLSTPPEKWGEDFENKKPLSIKIIERNWREVKQEFLELFEKYRRDK